jgi:hypothetical protein
LGGDGSARDIFQECRGELSAARGSLEQTGRRDQKQPATAPHLISATLSQLELHSLSQHCAWPH